MPRSLRSWLRPLNRGLVSFPPMRALIDRELAERGAADWSAPVVDRFINGPAGGAYGVTRAEKADFAKAFVSITANIESGTPSAVHCVLAEAILSIPPDADGAIVECGVWKGASSASLSRVCHRIGRRLIVCDSFEGLPHEGNKRHIGLHTQVYGHYREGMFKGALNEVQTNIQEHGNIDACEFIQGYFNESLAQLAGPVAFAFLDVDLESSTRDCLRALWPLLNDNAYLYSDDAGDLDVVKVFFDDPWWQAEVGCTAPGFVGSGCGLPLRPTYSSLGYTRKLGHFDPAAWRRVSFLDYPDEDSPESNRNKNSDSV